MAHWLYWGWLAFYAPLVMIAWVRWRETSAEPRDRNGYSVEAELRNILAHLPYRPRRNATPRPCIDWMSGTETGLFYLVLDR